MAEPTQTTDAPPETEEVSQPLMFLLLMLRENSNRELTNIVCLSVDKTQNGNKQ